MTIPELIEAVLGSIRGQFYGDKPAREFLRDRPALMKAIARWGYVCAQRGWDFQSSFIARDLCLLLNEIKRQRVEIKYLPTYLHGAVDKRVRVRAEELQAAARLLAPKVNRSVAGIRPVVVVERSDTEVLATLYRGLSAQQRQRRAGRVAGVKQKQGELL